jgi:diguanylate cyclase (GGDEF)-like protein
MFTISQEELQAIIGQLQQAAHYHEEWFSSLNRGLICGLPPDPDDLRENAHQLCSFGQWLENKANPRLHDHPAFVAITNEHRIMHQHAIRLCTVSISNRTIGKDDYDLFENSLQHLRHQISGLSHELQDMLYNRDPLTGANTRIGMLTKLREYHELARRGIQLASIVMIDLDHFKDINDNYGHQTGDQVLIECVQHLLQHIRVYDKVFRYGGEEFLLVMPATDIATAQQITERLRLEIAAIKIAGTNNEPVSVTASFGLTLLDPDVVVEKSIARADGAMYAAKKAGRNCIHVWEPTLDNCESEQ